MLLDNSQQTADFCDNGPETSQLWQKEDILSSLEKCFAQKLCSGFGQFHSPWNTRNPREYVTVSLGDIEAMAMKPPSVAKEKGQWFIPSARLTRNYSSQRALGQFWALWADIDDPGGKTFKEIFSLAGGDIPGKLLGYTSRSAKPDKQKSRLIVPLAVSVSGAEYAVLAKILNDKLEALGIQPDRKTELPGQIAYLPNKGEFYDFQIRCTSDRSLFHPSAWSAEIDAERLRLAAEADLQAQAQMEAQRKAKERMLAGVKSPMDAYNQAYDLPMVLTQYGHTQRGAKWLSPNSETGSPGVSIRGSKWFSSHGSDSEIGMETKGGRMGDAFDLFVHYEHQGDHKAALHAAGNMFTTADGVTIEKENQRQFMEQQEKKMVADMFDSTGQTKQDSSSGPQPEADAPANRFADATIWGQEALIAALKKSLSATWTVKNILPKDAIITVIWGPSGSYKSFLFGVDIGLSIATEKSWHGHKTKRGRVLYCVGEGQAGAIKRVLAWQKYHGYERTDNFGILPIPPTMDNKKQVEEFIGSYLKTMPEKPDVIILDTLARTMEGDENATQDMGAYIDGCTRIAKELGIQIIIIHHCGKDEARGMRGSYSLKAAADVEIKVAKLEGMQVKVCCEKQKDHPEFEPIYFEMHPVDLPWADDDGNILTSLVPVLGDKPVSTGKSKSLTGSNRIAFEALKEAMVIHGEEPGPDVQAKMADLIAQGNNIVVHMDHWRDIAYARGISDGEDDSAKRQAFRRAKNYLLNQKKCDTWNDYFWTTC